MLDLHGRNTVIPMVPERPSIAADVTSSFIRTFPKFSLMARRETPT